MAMFGVTRAPELDRPGLLWLNTPEPLGLARLRGRLVLLDFWTFCCVNCLHVLPTLRRVEEAFADEVTVIGVHSPKFDAERDPANLRAAIARYAVAHPVVHDPDRQLWRQYSIRAWPTLVFVSPDGYVIGQHSGEPDPMKLITAVRKTLDSYREKGAVAPQPLQLDLPAEAPSRFRFPGKLKPLPGPERHWVLADSGHHRIVVLDDDGRDIAAYGSGAEGFADGNAGTARFAQPQGLVADDSAIFVADTGNHAIRRIDRATSEVTTLAGTGFRGRILRDRAGPAREVGLASPWDLELAGRTLFIANAGTHQIGVLDLAGGTVRRFAGSGAEGLRDGSPQEAAFAQPSGLALSPDGRHLLVADSETSAIREVELRDGMTTTLVGAGLFEFGHVNGDLAAARLQHPLGVAAWGAGRLLVADSYNGEVRWIDRETATVGDLDGGRLTCADPVCLPLAEPAGVQPDGADRVLVVDTNNHRIVEFRIAAGISRSWAG